MPSRVARLLISADSHVMEPVDLWTSHLPPELRARGPRIEMRNDVPCLMVEDAVVRRFSAPRPAEKDGWKKFTNGASDPEGRLRDLDTDGVWGEVIYPNIAFFCCFHVRDPDLQTATARLYNDWVAEQFMEVSERFAPVAVVPVADVAHAVAELERAARRGFRGALLPAHIDFRPYNDPAYDRLWAAAQDLDLPLTFHAGTGRSQTPAHGPGGAVINYVVTVGGPMETVAYLCGSGVLARFPGLRVVMVECGSGWLAWVDRKSTRLNSSHRT